MKPIADLHCHPSLKPSGRENEDIWKDIKNARPANQFTGFLSIRKLLVGSIVKKLATYSQSNLDKCYVGKNRLLFCTIYPIERPFLKPNRPFADVKGVPKLLLKMIFGKDEDRDIDKKIIHLITGISKPTIDTHLDSVYDLDTVDYFANYEEEYQFLVDSHNTNSTNPNFVRNPSFRLVNSFEDYQAHLNETTLCGIVTIEGMHSIAVYNRVDLFEKDSITDLDLSRRNALEAVFKANIEKIKATVDANGNTAFPPFFITFSHHFNNLISGQAKSFADGNAIKPGFSDVFDQSNGRLNRLSTLASDLIENHLFSRHNGPRILVDTKHMSLDTRDDFYRLVTNFNNAHPNDKVPIICSHTAVNGLPDRESARVLPDINKVEKDRYVSKWDINLTDEDIEEIFLTDGLIGVCMHDGRMPGGKFRKIYKKIDKMINSKESIKRLHVQMFLTNIFHIVRVNLRLIRALNTNNPNVPIREQEAWKTISLGSDNDGIVDPFDHFNTSATLLDFKVRIIDAIKFNNSNIRVRRKNRILCLKTDNERPYTEAEMEDLKQGFSPEVIADKMFFDNTHAFLSKYFTKSYLHGTNP